MGHLGGSQPPPRNGPSFILSKGHRSTVITAKRGKSAINRSVVVNTPSSFGTLC